MSIPAPRTRWVVDAAPALLGSAVTALLLAVAGRYGYYRDEFYYMASGRRPALGYLDNPPLTPWLARLEVTLFGDAPTALRVLPAIALGLTVLITARIARELGGDRVAAAVAALAAAGSAFALATGHVLSTSTLDLLAWAALSWLLLRALRDGGRIWLLVGVVAGVALLNKALVLAFLGAVLVGVLAVGPRRALADRWLAAGALLGLAIWSPHLVWQGLHGWPQLAFGRQVAEVGNGGSEPRWAFPLLQAVYVSPLLVPVWVAGLAALVRDPAMRAARPFVVAYGVLFVLLLAVGGKPYYLAGIYPALLAAGAVATVRWVRRGRARGPVLGTALVANVVIVAWLMLPLIPERSLPASPQVAVSPIPAETVGWPELVATLAAVDRALPPPERAHAVVLTRNYGEAGAVELLGPRVGLPPAYSGHNSYGDWGPPPESATTVVAVGYDEATLRRWFADVRVVGRVDNAVGVPNEARDAPIAVASARRAPWAAVWRQLRHLA